MYQVCTHISDGLNKPVWDVSAEGLTQGSFRNSHFTSITKGRCVAVTGAACTKAYHFKIDQPVESFPDGSTGSWNNKAHKSASSRRTPSLLLAVPSAHLLLLRHGEMDPHTRPSEKTATTWAQAGSWNLLQWSDWDLCPLLKAAAALHQEKPLEQPICAMLCDGWCSAFPGFWFGSSSSYSVCAGQQGHTPAATGLGL